MISNNDDSKPKPAPTPNKRFYQWSEVHEIPRQPSKRAHICLLPGRFVIEGPDELITQTQTLAMVMEGQDGDEIKFALQKLWANWHVICSVSGEEILLCDLRYWKNGLIYARPELIANT
jgi:hypothetical protein